MVKKKSTHSDLTFEQIRAISYINHCEGVSQKQLAALLEVKPISATKIVTSLVDKGIIKRITAPNDNRAYQLYLTIEGKKRTKVLQTISEDVFKILTGGLSKKQIEDFHKTMLKIEDNIKNS